jgi:hypothetical protein
MLFRAKKKPLFKAVHTQKSAMRSMWVFRLNILVFSTFLDVGAIIRVPIYMSNAPQPLRLAAASAPPLKLKGRLGGVVILINKE